MSEETWKGCLRGDGSLRDFKGFRENVPKEAKNAFAIDRMKGRKNVRVVEKDRWRSVRRFLDDYPYYWSEGNAYPDLKVVYFEMTVYPFDKTQKIKRFIADRTESEFFASFDDVKKKEKANLETFFEKVYESVDVLLSMDFPKIPGMSHTVLEIVMNDGNKYRADLDCELPGIFSEIIKPYI